MDLIDKPINALNQISFQLIIGLLKNFLLVRMLCEVPDTLALRRFQLLLRFSEDLFQIFRSTLSFSNILLLAS